MTQFDVDIALTHCLVCDMSGLIESRLINPYKIAMDRRNAGVRGGLKDHGDRQGLVPPEILVKRLQGSYCNGPSVFG